MSEHEPECYALTHRDSGDDRCICDRLRQAEQRGRVCVMREWANTPGFDLATLVGFDATAQLVAAVAEYQGQRDALAAADAVVAAMPTAFWINSSTEEAQDHKRYVRAAIAALRGGS